MIRYTSHTLQLLAISITLTITALVLVSSAGVSINSDLLTRCESFPNDSAVLKAPLKEDLPIDVATTLSAYSDMTWNELDDVAKVGLLWVHGYVFSGGSTNGNKTGNALLEVYTRCMEGVATGVAMADMGVSYEDFTGPKWQCQAASCGSSYQATNANCVANITSAIQCAVNGTSTALQTVVNASFWSSASSSNTIPYPQVFEHSILMNDQIKTLQLYSIHMRNYEASVSCGSNSMDAIIPCLRLQDVSTFMTGTSGFCKPTVDAARLQSFIESVHAVKVIKYLDDDGDGNNDMDRNLKGGIGAAVLLIFLVLGVCRYRKKIMQTTGQPSELYVMGPTEEQSRTGSPLQSRVEYEVRVLGRHGNKVDSCTENSLHVSNNGHVQMNRGRASSLNTLGNASNIASTVYGYRSSMAGTCMGAGIGGKTVGEFCNESKALAYFVQDRDVLMKRITFDELTFLRILSKGAYGEVWLGQLETRHVAIKRLLPEKCQLTASLEQFAGEIKLMGLLQHRNIVLFIGVCWNWLQNMCAVVEYMDAGDLDEILKRKREQFSWQHEKISIAMDITEGLVYLHCLRPVIVHRDLKPKNVLLNRDFQAKLSDFGVSRKTRVNETMTSGVGTLLWTAPEIIAGKKYSEKADIYSLGVLLSEMDTCEPPFSDVTSDKGERLPGMQLAQLVRLGKIRVTLRKDCPPKLCKLVMDCTQLDPDARPSSMQVAFTLKSIIAPTLRLNSSAATTASSMCPSSESQNQANQAVECPPPSEKRGVAVPTHI